MQAKKRRCIEWVKFVILEVVHEVVMEENGFTPTFEVRTIGRLLPFMVASKNNSSDCRRLMIPNVQF